MAGQWVTTEGGWYKFSTGGGVGSAVLTFQGEQGYSSGVSSGASPNTFAAMPIGTASANRRVIAVITLGATYLGSPSSVTIGGVTATMQVFTGSGASTSSYSSQIVFAWADVPTGTTADVVVTGGTGGGDGFIMCATYTFDKTLTVNSSPTTNSNNVPITSSPTSITVTANTGAGGFVIAALAAELLGSATSMSITSSTETYTQDAISTGAHRLLATKKSGSAANTPTSVTFGWTGASQALAALLAWN
jgi:hypothetical protein